MATHGSAGDLAPVLPIVHALRAAGHDCRLAVPRFLGLHLRRLDPGHFTYGRGSQAASLRDDRLFTNRFAGWESWSRLATHHHAPSLPDEISSISAMLDTWVPDVVVTTTFALAPRIAARARGIREVTLSIYPQLRALGNGAGRSFARGLLDAVGAAAPAVAHDPRARASLAWGVTEPGALLHDPALLDPSTVPGTAALLGFPYWDDFPYEPEELERAHEWLAHRDRPVVLVTLGSFVRRPGTLPAIARTLVRSDLDVDVLIINAGERSQSARTLATGFLPLSRVAPLCAVAVHHGGIGTTFGAVRAAVPSVIVPQGFDQSFNASLVERAEIGRSSTIADLPRVLGTVLGNSSTERATRRVAGTLVSADDATGRACAHILDS